MPPLPRGLTRRGLELPRLGLGLARQYLDWPHSLDSVQVTPESLSADAVGRLFERVEARRHRIRAAEARTGGHWFWVAAELALILPRLHPKARARWRDTVRYAIERAERHVEELRALEILILAHEPEAERWLRRQLAGLSPLRPA